MGLFGCKLFCDVVDVARYSAGFLPFFYVSLSNATLGLVLALLIGFLQRDQSRRSRGAELGDQRTEEGGLTPMIPSNTTPQPAHARVTTLLTVIGTGMIVWVVVLAVQHGGGLRRAGGLRRSAGLAHLAQGSIQRDDRGLSREAGRES